MGLFDTLKNAKDLMGGLANNEMLSNLAGNKELIGSLMGNKNLMAALSQLKDNPELMSKLTAAKGSGDMQKLASTAMEAFKDMKLTDEEKKDLVSQLSQVVKGMGK